MLSVILLFTFFHIVIGDIEMIPPPDNITNEDNVIVAALWALGICSYAGLICKHKKKLPITVHKIASEKVYWDGTGGGDHYEIKKNDDKDCISFRSLKSSLNELSQIVNQLEKQSYEDIKNDFHKENNISMNIPENIRYKFGKAPITFKKNEKYYHGIYPTYYASWDNTGNWTSDHVGCMWHYKNKNVNFPHKEWDTHEIDGFCLNCSYCTDKNKKKKSRFVYQCNGHEITDQSLDTE